MTLCRFCTDIVSGIAGIVFIYAFWVFICLIIAPIAWFTSIVSILFSSLFGFYPTGLKEQIQKNLRTETAMSTMQQRMFYFTELVLIVPMSFVFTSSYSYRRYRTVTIFGRSIYPYHLIVIAFLYGLWSVVSHGYQEYSEFAEKVDMLAWVWVLGGICAPTVLILGILALSKSETGKLLRAYMRAKKQRVCPRITFTDD